MQMQEIRDIAREQGVKAGKIRKAELIRAIQKAEGNFDCFGSATTAHCDQHQCRWREDCLTDNKGS